MGCDNNVVVRDSKWDTLLTIGESKHYVSCKVFKIEHKDYS